MLSKWQKHIALYRLVVQVDAEGMRKSTFVHFYTIEADPQPVDDIARLEAFGVVEGGMYDIFTPHDADIRAGDGVDIGRAGAEPEYEVVQVLIWNSHKRVTVKKRVI